jgi:hypothetical protein
MHFSITYEYFCRSWFIFLQHSGSMGTLPEGLPNAQESVAARKAHHFQQLENLRQHWPGFSEEDAMDTPSLTRPQV